MCVEFFLPTNCRYGNCIDCFESHYFALHEGAFIGRRVYSFVRLFVRSNDQMQNTLFDSYHFGSCKDCLEYSTVRQPWVDSGYKQCL